MRRGKHEVVFLIGKRTFFFMALGNVSPWQNRVQVGIKLFLLPFFGFVDPIKFEEDFVAGNRIARLLSRR